MKNMRFNLRCMTDEYNYLIGNVLKLERFSIEFDESNDYVFTVADMEKLILSVLKLEGFISSDKYNITCSHNNIDGGEILLSVVGDNSCAVIATLSTLYELNESIGIAIESASLDMLLEKNIIVKDTNSIYRKA